jgi:hypothetical protein
MFLLLTTIAATIPLAVLTDNAYAQSSRKGGMSVIQKCYGKDGRSHRCDRLDENGQVKPEYRKKKADTK